MPATPPNPLKPPMQWRWWHKWLGIILLLPLLIVAVTAILLAHDRSLGLRQMLVAADWLPGYGEAMAGVEIRAAQRVGDMDYVATRLGLFTVRNGSVETIAALRGTELRDLAVAGDRLYAAARTGIWTGQAGQAEWRQLLKAEAWSVNIRADGSVAAATRERGLVVSEDGGAHWRSESGLARIVAEQSGVDPGAITLNRLILDLHTGKALFGKDYEWLWIDITGAAMVFLSVSGFIMWWRARRQRLRLEGLRQQKLAAQAAAGGLASR
ncbi:PepSY domain-containing protein [Ferrovibrio sp.]|uniref:PepSY domain-containing protein n=1 Tax=Ferrovibrio sp. TaxID=1917215 RepID=UPI003D13C0FF